MGGEMESEGGGLEWRFNTAIATRKDGAACPTLEKPYFNLNRGPRNEQNNIF